MTAEGATNTHGPVRQPGVPRAAKPLFAVLWFVATYWFWGSLGRWMDDWSFQKRNPVSGEFAWGDVLALDPWGSKFWRALHMRVGSGLPTVLWNHDWAIHLVLALLHGLNTWLLWKVVGRMCGGKQAPAAAALVFLVYPAGYEAVFWISTLGTSVGLTCLLACILAVQRFAAGELSQRKLLGYLPLLVTIPMWYEQPAAAAPAAALAYLACAPSSRPWRQRLAHATLIGAVAAIVSVGYALLLMKTVPAMSSGGSRALVTGRVLEDNLRTMLGHYGRNFALRAFAEGAAEEGWRAIRGKPWQAIVTGAVLVFGVARFASWWMRAERPGEHNALLSRERQTRLVNLGMRFWSLAFGAALVVASVVPVVIVANPYFATRLAYVPAAGLAVVVATLIDVVLGSHVAQGRAWPGRLLRAGALAVLVPILVAGAVMMAGVQSSRNALKKMDRRVAAELRNLAPNPAPHTVFVPMGLSGWPTRTGSARFDQISPGPFEASWSATPFVRFAYRRADLHALGFSRWADPASGVTETAGGSERGLVLTVEKLPRQGEGACERDWALRPVVPWDRVIAFKIDQHGGVRLINRVALESQDDPARDVVVDLTRTRKNGKRRGAQALMIMSPRGKIESGAVWTRISNDDGHTPAGPVTPSVVRAMGRVIPAMTLHPVAPWAKDVAIIERELAPSSVPRKIGFRVGSWDFIWRPVQPLNDGFGVSVKLVDPESGAITLVGRELITPQRLKSARNFIGISMSLPPLDRSKKLRIELDPGDAGSGSADWCLMTTPVVSE